MRNWVFLCPDFVPGTVACFGVMSMDRFDPKNNTGRNEKKDMFNAPDCGQHKKREVGLICTRQKQTGEGEKKRCSFYISKLRQGNEGRKDIVLKLNIFIFNFFFGTGLFFSLTRCIL